MSVAPRLITWTVAVAATGLLATTGIVAAQTGAQNQSTSQTQSQSQSTTPKPPAPFVVGTADTPAPAPKTDANPVPLPPPPVKKLPDPPADQIPGIIQAFMGKEKLFRQQLANNYVYTEVINVVESDINTGTPDGHFDQTNEIQFSPEGQRRVVCTYCPAPLMKNVVLTEADIDDFFNMDMNTFSIDDLPKLNVTYVDHEPLDQISAFVFAVSPKKPVKGEHLFQGRVWVDDRDLMIVKSSGKTPDEVDKHGHVTNYFLPTTIWRQLIDGKNWFPVYTEAVGEIPPDLPHNAPGGKIKIVVQFKNYRQFHATARVIANSTKVMNDSTTDGTKPPATTGTDANGNKTTTPPANKGGGGGGGGGGSINPPAAPPMS